MGPVATPRDPKAEAINKPFSLKDYCYFYLAMFNMVFGPPPVAETRCLVLAQLHSRYGREYGDGLFL